MKVDQSILYTIKTMIGGDVESNDFDIDLIVAINSAISTLYQIGIETKNTETGAGFAITGDNETWSDYLSDYKYLDMVKSYIYQRVRLIFDPPQNTVLISSIQEQIKEIEWRITVAIETDNTQKGTKNE